MQEPQAIPPQKSPGSASVDPLEERLRRWLKDQGYPLELRTARAFREKGRVRQSDYYWDAEADCYREIDVLVQMRAEPRRLSGWLDMLLCIEVKSAPDKPWVLFSGSEDSPLHPIASVVQRIASAPTSKWLRPAARSPEVRDLPLLAVESYAGHNLIRASLGPNQREDIAYKAILSAIKAAHWEASRRDQNPNGVEISTIAFPVVVIDAPLFKCSLDETSDELKLWRVDSGTLIWRNSLAPTNAPHTMVHIVTEPALPEFSERAGQTLEGLERAYTRFHTRNR
ncbi:hypothetical protein [Micromonospora sp. WMMD975]|uniref:hypothetical protein n=1 Tax=Micromonospora sp. WMMD975 TaxID=3016087 RepID=UPI00249A5FB6|nr:hypothetical protein [Micromonospora sp. WMMD975]WFE32601.1 hypothetical protein O7613_24015 [Micromonospora sp. WMMD975]